MTDDWQQVNIRVREHNYSEWKEAANTEYGGITDLIRTSVRNEINGEHDATAVDTEATGDSVVTEIAETVDRLESAVKDMDNRLNTVRESVESNVPEISVTAAVRETVPEPEQGATADYYAEYGLTVTQIAARLDANESDVSEALDELQASGVVEGVTGGEPPETVYVRTGGA